MRFPAFWGINSGQKSVVLSFIQENVAFIPLLIYQPDNQWFIPTTNEQVMKSKLRTFARKQTCEKLTET